MFEITFHSTSPKKKRGLNLVLFGWLFSVQMELCMWIFLELYKSSDCTMIFYKSNSCPLWIVANMKASNSLKITSIPLKLTGQINIKLIFGSCWGTDMRRRRSRVGGRSRVAGIKWLREHVWLEVCMGKKGDTGIHRGGQTGMIFFS